MGLVGKAQRALEYTIAPMSEQEMDEIVFKGYDMSEGQPGIAGYYLSYNGYGDQDCIRYNYSPYVQFPFAIWWKEKGEDLYHCLHAYIHFMNNMNGSNNAHTFNELVQYMNSPKGKIYVLGEIEKELGLKKKHKELNLDERKLEAVSLLRHEDEITVNFIPMFIDTDMKGIFETNRAMIDGRFILEDESKSVELYSFATFNRDLKEYKFWNVFWDTKSSGVEDTEVNMDRLLIGNDDEVMKKVLGKNKYGSYELLHEIEQFDTTVVGVFPVYIKNAFILDAKILHLNYNSSYNK